MTKSVFTRKYQIFREMLIQARKAAGLNQRDLSEKMSRPQSFISKYEQGERRLDVVEFLEVAENLGIDSVDFIRELNKACSNRD
ncbi:MAG TPA: helix-turn-helix transcriptional regulator [Candidatus Sumerlaeota bacterium]|nr:helix-turn-helix transcriptional regulator [Candidatus Sumerlaeota bacterium]HPS01636.1 helix-turn-helix transcriptional regulator [Candidatus Sumerlaeota bacterium]